MFYGRVVGVSSFTEHPDACMAVIRTLLTPERRVLSMDDAQSGSDMLLKTDYEPEAWNTLTPAPEFLEVAKAAIDEGFPEMLMPGTGEYMDALQAELHGFVNGSGTAEEAMARVEENWQAITERYGRESQKEAWAQVRAQYAKAGLSDAG